ncbi:MAG: hypothetical protein ACRD2L_01545 [Terriglobia bacterium]
MATYRWRIEFSLLGVPIASSVTLDAIHLAPAFPDEKGRSRSIGYLVIETDQYLQDLAVEADALSQLEFVAIAAAALGGSVREPVVTSVRLENRDDLEAAGVRTPLENASLTVRYNVIAPDIEETALTKCYRTAVRLEGQEASLWRRAARWLWKANSEADPYDQFLALWISFNVLYGPLKTNSEQRAIQDYLAKEIPREPDAEKFLAEFRSEDLDLLGASGLTLKSRNWPVANELQTALALPAAQQSRRRLVALAFLTIYAVRCGIVHEGGVEVPRDSESRLVWASVHVLKPAIMRLLRNRLGVRVEMGSE